MIKNLLSVTILLLMIAPVAKKTMELIHYDKLNISYNYNYTDDNGRLHTCHFGESSGYCI